MSIFEDGIGVDIDGVLYRFLQAIQDFAYQDTGNKNVYKPQTTWNLWENWEISKEEFKRIFNSFAAHGKFAFGQEMPEASKYMNLLFKEGFKIKLITARYEGLDKYKNLIIQNTAQWLEKASIPYHDLYFTKDKHEIKASVYIDDAPHNLENLRAKTSSLVLGFDNGYIQNWDGEKYTNWEQIYNRIKRFEDGEK